MEIQLEEMNPRQSSVKTLGKVTSKRKSPVICLLKLFLIKQIMSRLAMGSANGSKELDSVLETSSKLSNFRVPESSTSTTISPTTLAPVPQAREAGDLLYIGSKIMTTATQGSPRTEALIGSIYYYNSHSAIPEHDQGKIIDQKVAKMLH